MHRDYYVKAVAKLEDVHQIYLDYIARAHNNSSYLRLVSFQKTPYRFSHDFRYGYVAASRLLYMGYDFLIEDFGYYNALVTFSWHIIVS